MAAPGYTHRRGAVALAAERVRRFIKRYRILVGPAEQLMRIGDSMPLPMARSFDWVTQKVKRRADLSAVFHVMDALAADGVPCWLAGGWGVDALLGAETRRHSDIDIVVGDFEHDAPRAARVLESLGFEHVKSEVAGVWMPFSSRFEDDVGCGVEVLGIDWGHLRGVLAFDPGRSPRWTGSCEELAGEVFAEGSLAGRQVPCLSGSAQLLFHTGFSLKRTAEIDVSRLRSQLLGRD